MISKVVDENFLVIIERIDRKSPNFDITVQKTSYCVSKLSTIVNCSDGQLFFSQVHYFSV